MREYRSTLLQSLVCCFLMALMLSANIFFWGDIIIGHSNIYSQNNIFLAVVLLLGVCFTMWLTVIAVFERIIIYPDHLVLKKLFFTREYFYNNFRFAFLINGKLFDMYKFKFKKGGFVFFCNRKKMDEFRALLQDRRDSLKSTTDGENDTF